MTGTFSKTARVQAKVLIQRTGTEVDVMRDDGTATVDDYGKINDVDRTMEKVGVEVVSKVYPSETNEPSLRGATGGRRQTDEPNIHLQYDTIIEEGDRLDFPDGTSYRVERMFDLGSHYETESTIVK